MDSELTKVYIQSRNEKNKVCPQLLAAISANVAAIITGCVIGWTSPSLPILEGPNSPIPITKTQNSWIASLMPLAATFGPFAAGFLVERFGSKRALLIASVPFLISWIALATGRSVEVIYVSRIIAGFTVGWIFTVLPIYCAEIADKSVRGALGSLMQIFIVFGLLFDYCIGPYIPYMWLSIGAAIIPILFVLIFFWMPESPYYLLKIKQKKKADKSLQWLRGKSSDEVFQELMEIQETVDKEKHEKSSLRNFSTKGNRKALIISLGLVGFQQLSGINIILFNAQSIFQKSGSSFKAEESAIITGVIMLVAATVTPFIVDKLGRKFLFLISGVGMTISQAILGLCFFLERKGHDTSSINFLPVIAVVAYIIIYCVGFGPLPWAVMGEMFPGNIKSLASTLTASFCWILGFLVTRFFNDVVEIIGNDYTFWLFGGFCVAATLFVAFYVPETKGKSLSEIQELLNKSS